MNGSKLRFAVLVLLMIVLCVWLSVSLSKTAFASDWSSWSSPKQATFYTDLGGTASGRIIHSDSKYVAVDMSRIVSKKAWKKLSNKDKKRYFYYGEKIKLQRLNGKHKGKKRTLIVADCGSFCGAGQYWKGSWRSRWFDLTDGARRGFITWNEGVGIVKWRYAK